MFFIPVPVLILAFISGVSVYWILFWFIVLWLGGSLAWLLYTAWNLELDIELKDQVMIRKESTSIKIRLFNESFLPFPYGELLTNNWSYRDMSGANQKLFDQDQKQDDNHTRIFQFFFNDRQVDSWVEVTDINPLGGWQRVFDVKCYTRGKFYIGPMKIRIFSPFSVFLVEKKFDEKELVTVQPRLLSFIGQFDASGSDPQGITRKKNTFFQPMDYMEVHDLRPFVSGDPLKLINWKVSARQGELYVKRIENTGDERLLLCVEFSKKYYYSREQQDLLLEKALSVVKYFSDNNIQLGILTIDDNLRYLPPSSGRNQWQLARKLFTDLKRNTSENLPSYFQRTSQTMKGNKILWLTPYLDRHYKQGLKTLASGGTQITLLIDQKGKNIDIKDLTIPAYQLNYYRGQVAIKEVFTS